MTMGSLGKHKKNSEKKIKKCFGTEIIVRHPPHRHTTHEISPMNSKCIPRVLVWQSFVCWYEPNHWSRLECVQLKHPMRRSNAMWGSRMVDWRGQGKGTQLSRAGANTKIGRRGFRDGYVWTKTQLYMWRHVLIPKLVWLHESTQPD